MRFGREELIHLLGHAQLDPDSDLFHAGIMGSIEPVRQRPGGARTGVDTTGGGRYPPCVSIIPLAERALPADCLVFKHSTTCPVSAEAAREVRGLDAGLPVYQVNVREQRDLSNWVAAAYGVTHQSPQLILVRGGKAVRSWSHWDVNRASVAKELAAGPAGRTD
jgi:bacillithiol system protein YtxJ